MMKSYARQVDLDKLAVKLDKFMDGLNHLLITKEVHELAQKSIFEKLNKIEYLIEKHQENSLKAHQSIEERVRHLENKNSHQAIFRKFVYAQWGVVAALSSQHFPKLSHFFLNFFNF